MSSPTPDWSQFGNYGLLGVMFVALLVFSYRLIQREWRRADEERARADRERDEVSRLNAFLQEKVVPALVEGGSALRDSNDLVRDLTRHPPNR